MNTLIRVVQDVPGAQRMNREVAGEGVTEDVMMRRTRQKKEADVRVMEGGRKNTM